MLVRLPVLRRRGAGTGRHRAAHHRERHRPATPVRHGGGTRPSGAADDCALAALAAVFAATYALDRDAPAARWLPSPPRRGPGLPAAVRGPARGALVVGWAALAVALGLLGRWDSATARNGAVGGATLLTLGLAVALVAVAPPARLVVRAGAPIEHRHSGAARPPRSARSSARWRRGRSSTAPKAARLLAELAGVVAVYLLSVGTVDLFAGRIDGGALVSLQKQAQVALSILWAALGGLAFVGGAVRRLTALRLSGLALLAVATVKVFLVDMASLDATYRVPSFVALGLFLLASSYVYQRLRPLAAAAGEAGGD
ncbi:MAG: DUF2339 domain-containing protein [Thermomicrobiales bacterium]